MKFLKIRKITNLIKSWNQYMVEKRIVISKMLLCLDSYYAGEARNVCTY